MVGAPAGLAERTATGAPLGSTVDFGRFGVATGDSGVITGLIYGCSMGASVWGIDGEAVGGSVYLDTGMVMVLIDGRDVGFTVGVVDGLEGD